MKIPSKAQWTGFHAFITHHLISFLGNNHIAGQQNSLYNVELTEHCLERLEGCQWCVLLPRVCVSMGALILCSWLVCVIPNPMLYPQPGSIYSTHLALSTPPTWLHNIIDDLRSIYIHLHIHVSLTHTDIIYTYT